MATLTFYRQKRLDGGIRTGLELEGDYIAERFQEGNAERNPTVLWYVDLRCAGEGVPDDPDVCIPWLIQMTPVIHAGFLSFAELLRAGVDPDIYNLSWSDFQDLPAGVSMSIACSATRRVDGRAMAGVTREIGEHWAERLQELDVYEEVGDQG